MDLFSKHSPPSNRILPLLMRLIAAIMGINIEVMEGNLIGISHLLIKNTVASLLVPIRLLDACVHIGFFSQGIFDSGVRKPSEPVNCTPNSSVVIELLSTPCLTSWQYSMLLSQKPLWHCLEIWKGSSISFPDQFPHFPKHVVSLSTGICLFFCCVNNSSGNEYPLRFLEYRVFLVNNS